MYTAKITDTIAHFIGQFQLTLEEVQQRKAYDEIKALQALAEETPELPDEDVTVKAPHQLNDFDPDIPYVPVPPVIEKITVTSNVWFNPPEIPIPGQQAIIYPGFLTPHGPALNMPAPVPAGSPDLPLPEDQPLGQVSVIVNQVIRLSDNDYFSVGGHGLEFTYSIDDSEQLDSLLDAGATLSPIDDLAMPGSANIASFITTAAERLDSFSSSDPNVFVVKADTIDGTYVNGQLINEEDTPKLEDHVEFFKKKDDDATDDATDDKPSEFDSDSFDVAPNSPDFMAGLGDGRESPAVELQAGGNTHDQHGVADQRLGYLGRHRGRRRLRRAQRHRSDQRVLRQRLGRRHAQLVDAG